MKVKVEVTKRDIAKGKRNDCNACPITLATTRALKLPRHFSRMHVITDTGGVGLSISQYDQPLYFTMKSKDEKKVDKFIRDFDESLPVEPFSFMLDA